MRRRSPRAIGNSSGSRAAPGRRSWRYDRSARNGERSKISAKAHAELCCPRELAGGGIDTVRNTARDLRGDKRRGRRGADRQDRRAVRGEADKLRIDMDVAIQLVDDGVAERDDRQARKRALFFAHQQVVED